VNSTFDLDRAPKRRLKSWLTGHLQSLFSSLGLLFRSPGAALLTSAVIGVALALPTGFLLLLNNAERLGRGWEGNTEISVFLRMEVGDGEAARLAREIALRRDVDRVRVVSRAAALEEYKQRSGFTDVIAAFGDRNPLPTVLLVEPPRGIEALANVAGLVASLRAMPEVDLVLYDLKWLRRFEGIVGTLRRGTMILASLLALGVILIVGNTIRLTIDGRREEILIAKLCGATDAFIRRPFLYSGLWHGMVGGLIAAILVGVGFELLRGPVAHLAELYHSEFALTTQGSSTILRLVMIGGALGLGGAWAAVARHLRIEETA